MTFVTTAYVGLAELAERSPRAFTAGELDQGAADPTAVVGRGYDLQRTILAPDGTGGETPGTVRFRILHTTRDTVKLDAGFAWNGPGGRHQSTADYDLTEAHAHMLARAADEEAEAPEPVGARADADADEPADLGDAIGGFFTVALGAADDIFSGNGVPGTWRQMYPGSDLPADSDDEAASNAADAAKAYHAMVINAVAPTYPALVMLSDDEASGFVATFELPTLFHWLREQPEVAPVG